ncbi:MAG TPA: c-type cytochrome [Cyclobacteriaceae bacterium]|nr:c-type cytochrome [Cyclobacteriaceae bacterium]
MYKISYNVILIAPIIVLLSACTGGRNEPPIDVSVTPFKAQISAAESPKDYIDQLGCLNCHGGATLPNELKTKAPDLSLAGSRFKPEYIFNYLLNPTQVRNHIGLSRMPNFGFDEREALALTHYLSSKRAVQHVQFPDFSDEGNVRLGEKEFNEQACSTCHMANGRGNNVISDLSNMGSKLNPEWMKQFIAAPAAFQKESIMPGLLYHFNTDSTALISSVDNAEEKIENLSAYLLSLEAPDYDEQLDTYETIKESNPEISVELGQIIYQAQNCAGCHQSNPDGEWKEMVAPDLMTIKSRINKAWLAEYVKKPHAVRPFGFYPGSGSRMPNFNLTEIEIENIVRFIYNEENNQKQNHIEAPSRFVSNKIKVLLDEKLPCLGCHSLGGQGGKIAPELANLSKRLNSDYLAAVVTDPAVAMPGTIMPKISMPENMRDQLIGYLLYNKDTVAEGKYLSLVDHPITLQDASLTPESIYLSKCAICHGEKGNANGFNAEYLATQPTKHADSSYMTRRPDDTLFDGVFAGGDILNRSHLMPAWGNALSNDEIKGLVTYMRGLCNCSPPKWSTDNKKLK